MGTLAITNHRRQITFKSIPIPRLYTPQRIMETYNNQYRAVWSSYTSDLLWGITPANTTGLTSGARHHRVTTYSVSFTSCPVSESSTSGSTPPSPLGDEGALPRLRANPKSQSWSYRVTRREIRTFESDIKVFQRHLHSCLHMIVSNTK